MQPRVVVVGAGNAALAASVAARAAGAKRVVVLEKASRELRGGNTHYSGGVYRFAYDNVEALLPLLSASNDDLAIDMQRIQPYPEDDFRNDLQRITGERTDPELSEVLITGSYDAVRWIGRKGIQMEVAAKPTGGTRNTVVK